MYKTIESISKKEHGFICIGLLCIFTVADTFFHAKVFNEPFWYMTLYFIAAYIRMYPCKYSDSLKLTSMGLLLTVLLAIVSVVFLTYVGFGGTRYILMVDSDKILAFLVGLYSFLMFKNQPNFHNKIINFLVEGTFAVYLIHTAGPNMLKWLWTDTLSGDKMYNSAMTTLLVHVTSSVIIIFLVCSMCDRFRWCFIVKPLFYYLSNINRPRWITKFSL